MEFSNDGKADKKVLREYGIEEYEIYNPSRESLERALKEFRDWSKGLKNIVLAGHNTHLDIKFLKRSMERYGLEWDFGYRAVDLFSIAIGILKNQGEKIPEINGLFDLNFDNILERVGLKKRKKPYDALENARLKAEAFNRLVYGKSLFEEFQG